MSAHGWLISPRSVMANIEAMPQANDMAAKICAGLLCGPECAMCDTKKAADTRHSAIAIMYKMWLA